MLPVCPLILFWKTEVLSTGHTLIWIWDTTLLNVNPRVWATRARSVTPFPVLVYHSFPCAGKWRAFRRTGYIVSKRVIPRVWYKFGKRKFKWKNTMNIAAEDLIMFKFTAAGVFNLQNLYMLLGIMLFFLFFSEWVVRHSWQ